MSDSGAAYDSSFAEAQRKVSAPPFTDQQKADAYRAEILPHLTAACAVIDKAKKDGLVIGFNLTPDQYGRQTVQALTVVKPL